MNLLQMEREKKFKCPIQGCRSTYSQQYSLKQHFAAHHMDHEVEYPHLMPRRSSFLRRKKNEVDRKYACPVPTCDCGYEEKKLLKRHFKIKHPDRLHEFPDLVAEKRKWQRPGELRAYHCDVPGCHSSYSSVSNLKQHVRVEHAELYGEKFPNAMRRRRKQSGGKTSLKFMSESSVDDEFQESDTSSQQSDSWSFEDETKTQMGEPMFIEEGGLHLLADTALQTAQPQSMMMPPLMSDQLLLPYHYPQVDHSNALLFHSTFQPPTSSSTAPRSAPCSFQPVSGPAPLQELCDEFAFGREGFSSRRQSERMSKRKKCQISGCQFHYSEEERLKEHIHQVHYDVEGELAHKRQRTLMVEDFPTIGSMHSEIHTESIGTNSDRERQAGHGFNTLQPQHSELLPVAPACTM